VSDTVDFRPLALGTPHDMGTALDGRPLIDPRIFDSTEFRRNPYPYYRVLRDHYPVYWDKLHNRYLITRYEDVRAAYLDGETYNTIPKGSSNLLNGNTILELGGRDHARRRRLFSTELAGQPLEARLPAIRRLALEMITLAMEPTAKEMAERNIGGRRTIELGRAFANEFPIRVVGEVLGFPVEAQNHFYYWYTSIQNGRHGSEKAREGLQARKDLENYVWDLVKQRRHKPTFLYDEDGESTGEDMISRLSRAKIDGNHLSLTEIVSMISVLVSGGGDTTRGAILHMWRLLLEHPEQLAAVQEDPELLHAAFHETLRHASPVGGMSRSTNYDTVLHGVTIPAGAWVELVNFSANHDERIFPDPETFNIFRPELYTGKEVQRGYQVDGKHSHMGFGLGAHFCPGAWVAHQETVIGSRILLEHMQNPRLSPNKIAADAHGGMEPIYTDRMSQLTELWIDCDGG
jgi:pulcherriminic acid synthase